MPQSQHRAPARPAPRLGPAPVITRPSAAPVAGRVKSPLAARAPGSTGAGADAGAGTAAGPDTPTGAARARPSHECNICKKRFTKRSNMLIHERLHTGEKPYVCSHGCGKRYSWLSSINFHETRCTFRLGHDGGGGDQGPDAQNQSSGKPSSLPPPTTTTGAHRPPSSVRNTKNNGSKNASNTKKSKGAINNNFSNNNNSLSNHFELTARNAAMKGKSAKSIKPVSPNFKHGSGLPPLSTAASRSRRPRPSRSNAGSNPSKPLSPAAAFTKRRTAARAGNMVVSRLAGGTQKKPRSASSVASGHPKSPTSVRPTMSDELDALLAGEQNFFPASLSSYQQPQPQPSVAPPGLAMYQHPRPYQQHQQQQQQQQNDYQLNQSHEQQTAVPPPQDQHVSMQMPLSAPHPHDPFFAVDVLAEPLSPQSFPTLSPHEVEPHPRLHGQHQHSCEPQLSTPVGHPSCHPPVDQSQTHLQPHALDTLSHGHPSLPIVSSPVTPALHSQHNSNTLKPELLLDDFSLAGVDLFSNMSPDRAAPHSDMFVPGFTLDSTELSIF